MKIHKVHNPYLLLRIFLEGTKGEKYDESDDTIYS
jgi:hypothetical protein